MTMPSHLQIFTSFQQCNDYLKVSTDIDILSYIDLTHHIPYDHERSYLSLKFDIKLVNGIIKFLIQRSKYDTYGFDISLSELYLVGINTDTYASKLPRFVQTFMKNSDCNLNRERRLLRRNKLVKNIDFIENTNLVDGEIVIMGYNISRLALYRILSNHYGSDFMEAILCRMGQVLYFYDQYKLIYMNTYIESLKRTIVGLSEDIKELSKCSSKHPSYINFDDTFNDNKSYFNSYPSPINSDLILKDEEYADELTTIHKLIETNINRVDTRISDIAMRLGSIDNKIDELVDSISNPPEDLLSSKVSSMITPPVINHVNSIFKQYREFGRASLSPLESNITRRSIHGQPNRHTHIGI